MIVEDIDAVGNDRVSWRLCVKVCRDLLPCASLSIPIVAQVDSSRSSATFPVTMIAVAAITPSISTRDGLRGGRQHEQPCVRHARSPPVVQAAFWTTFENWFLALPAVTVPLFRPI
jgi:hypothetical protein